MSYLFDLIEVSYLNKFCDKVMQEDDLDYGAKAEEAKKNLSEGLTDEQKKLFNLFALNLENRIDTVHFALEDRVLCIGVKIGMELQKVFDSENFENP